MKEASKLNNKFQEDEVTEFKKSTSELKEAIVSIVAILNKHKGGKLYFGIKDDGTIVDQQISSKTLRAVSEAITTNIEPRIYPKVTNIKIELRYIIREYFLKNIRQKII